MVKKKETITVTLRIPADLHGQIAEMGERELRSLNSQIVMLLLQAVEQTERRSESEEKASKRPGR